MYCLLSIGSTPCHLYGDMHGSKQSSQLVKVKKFIRLQSARLVTKEADCFCHGHSKGRYRDVKFSSNRNRCTTLHAMSKKRYGVDTMVVKMDSEKGNDSAKGLGGTIFSAIALITGSTVGAGMLALPAVTEPVGFVPTMTGLTATWAMLTMQALLIAEVNLSLWSKKSDQLDGNRANLGPNYDSTEQDTSYSKMELITLRQMAEYTLGRAGKSVIFIYLALSYGLLVAYITKASEIIDFFTFHQLPTSVGSLGFIVAAIVFFLKGGSSGVDRLNQVCTSLLLILYAMIVTTGFREVDVISSLASETPNWSALPPALPIILLSLVYHDLVPVICSMLGGDRGSVRSAIVLGSLIPLAMFGSWEAVALGISHSPTPGINDAMMHSVPNMDPLQVFIDKSGPLIGTTVQSFSFLAVLTSFLGTTLGLSETIQTELPSVISDLREKATWYTEEKVHDNKMKGNSPASDVNRALALILTLIPPFIFSVERPDAFLTALSVVGGTGMTILFCILPPIMTWRMRKMHNPSNGSDFQLVPGGDAVLAGLFLVIVGFSISRVVPDDSSMLSSLLESLAFIQTIL